MEDDTAGVLTSLLTRSVRGLIASWRWKEISIRKLFFISISSNQLKTKGKLGQTGRDIGMGK